MTPGTQLTSFIAYLMLLLGYILLSCPLSTEQRDSLGLSDVSIPFPPISNEMCVSPHPTCTFGIWIHSKCPLAALGSPRFVRSAGLRRPRGRLFCVVLFFLGSPRRVSCSTEYILWDSQRNQISSCLSARTKIATSAQVLAPTLLAGKGRGF